MLKQVLSVVFNYKYSISRWIDNLLHEKKEVQKIDTRRKGDWLSQDPSNWYSGPLILLEETQEGLKEYQTSQSKTKKRQKKEVSC